VTEKLHVQGKVVLSRLLPDPEEVLRAAGKVNRCFLKCSGDDWRAKAWLVLTMNSIRSRPSKPIYLALAILRAAGFRAPFVNETMRSMYRRIINVVRGRRLAHYKRCLAECCGDAIEFLTSMLTDEIMEICRRLDARMYVG